MCFSPQRRAILRHLNLQKCAEAVMFCTFSLPNVLFATAACNFSTSEQTKVLRTRHVLYILTFKCAFPPQRRAIFRHLNFKKWSEDYSFLTFSLPNVLFTTAACNFATSELTKVRRTRHVLYIFTSECGFRHSGVQFFDIWTSKSSPNMRCFVHFYFKMCFSPQRRANFCFLCWTPTSAPAALTGLLLDWPDTRIIEKTQHFATSLTFGADVSSFFWLSRYCIFFLLTWLLYSAFQLSILSEVSI